MTDTPRDVRDRLGEALRARDLEEWGGPPRPWASENGTTKHRYRAMADDFLALAASCGLKIVPDDGEMKVKDEIPADLADALRRLGKVEWGEVGPKADAEHVGDFADIREPDEAMLSAMVQAAAEGNIEIVPEEARAIWHAGIDKALEGQG